MEVDTDVYEKIEVVYGNIIGDINYLHERVDFEDISLEGIKDILSDLKLRVVSEINDYISDNKEV